MARSQKIGFCDTAQQFFYSVSCCIRQVATTYVGTYSAYANCQYQFGTAADAGRTVSMRFEEFLVDLTGGDNLTVYQRWGLPGAPAPLEYHIFSMPQKTDGPVEDALELPLRLEFRSNDWDHRYVMRLVCTVAELKGVPSPQPTPRQRFV